MTMTNRLQLRVSPCAFFFALLLLPVLALAEPPALPATPEKPADFARALDWKGGDGEGFALAAVRLGSHGGFERLVFEFAGGSKGAVLPRLAARSETYPERLVLDLSGLASRAQGAELSYQTLRKSRLLSGLAFVPSCGSGASAVILPARPVRYALSVLKNPSRLVVDLAEAEKLPLPDLRYSLQTMALEGDAACLFLEMVQAEKGAPGRLLGSVAGRTVGEAGLYDTPEDARKAMAGLPRLLESFSLEIKARGPLDVPQD
jgi:hypothetical protein